MIVVVPIGLLALIVFANYVHGPGVRNATHQGRDAMIRETCRAIGNAANSYRQDKGRAPQSIDDLINSGYLIALPPDFKQEDCKW